MSSQKIGSIGWFDLTVEKAENIRDVYSSVVGWTSSSVEMDGYSDFCMNQPEDDATVAGICHARGGNTNLPSQWLMYITVTDLDARLDACRAAGGRVVMEPRSSGGTARFAVIQDPAGATVALFDAGAA